MVSEKVGDYVNNRASRRYRIIFIVLSALMIAFAFVHSMMNADQSSAESDGLAKLLQSILNSLGFTGDFHFPYFRKLAHFTEFAAVGALLTCTAHGFRLRKTYTLCPQILLTGLLAALCDETIQIFTPGRASAVTDVWIDFGGVVFGTLLLLLLFAAVQRAKNKKTEIQNE